MCKTCMSSHKYWFSHTIHFTFKANGTCPVEEINTDCHIIASVTTGVATGSRRVKPKDVRDRVSEAFWAVLLGDQCDTVILSALVVVIFKVSQSVALSLACTHILGKYLVPS